MANVPISTFIDRDLGIVMEQLRDNEDANLHKVSLDMWEGGK